MLLLIYLYVGYIAGSSIWNEDNYLAFIGFAQSDAGYRLAFGSHSGDFYRWQQRQEF